MEPHPSAPPLVAVVVTADPGEWFEESLAALDAQDYPNQSVLVLDTASRADTPPRVAGVLPEAYLRRLDGSAGFAAVANDVLGTVEGSAFLLFCHDDVALEPDAVRRLVEEALRSNAGVVGAKLVHWDQPERLLEVGLAVDKTGAATSLVEPGELDQEQHDAVRDVFAVSSTCMLLRSDLFATLGGFDPVMDERSADIDLCWRAQLAGARVLVAPAARARHRRDDVAPLNTDGDGGHLEARHHLRTMLKSYSFPHLFRVLPQAAVITVVEAVIAVAGRRWSDARQLLSAWPWNLRRMGQLRPLRRSAQKLRAIPDSEVRRLQVRGSVRLSGYLRRRLHAEERAQALLNAGHHLVDEVQRGPTRTMATLLALVALAVVVGSRHLFGGRLPLVGEFAPFPRPSTLLTHFITGWRTTGMGSQAPAPPAFGLLGMAGGVLLGGVGLLQKLLVLGAWPVAAVGAWRLARPLHSTMGRLFAVIAYLAVPLPYNALARGHWSALVAYAAAPWLLAALARVTGLAPYASEDKERSVAVDEEPAVPWPVRCLRLGVPLALVLALSPSLAVALLVAAVGLLLGTLLTGETGRTPLALAVAAGAIGVAMLLLFPWSLDLLLPGRSSTVFGVARLAERSHGLGELLRFHVGPMGAGPLGWTLLAVAALPIVVGTGWRLAWAARFWGVALTCFVVAWAGGRGWLPLQFQSPDVLLAFAAAALAGAAALSAVSFERDLPAYRFGWRQVAPLLAGLALAASTLPVLAGAREGRWELTDDEVAQSVAWMGAEAPNGAFRVLWIGDPEVLPLPGWRLDEGIAYATSRNGPPEATDLFPGPAAEGTGQIADALDVARQGDTARLGRLLAPMAVRYLVVPSRLSTTEDSGPPAPLPVEFAQALGSQLDLRVISSDPALAVYENTAWGPGRALLVGEAAAASQAPGSIPTERSAGVDLRGGQPVLTEGGPVRFAGSLPEAGPVLLSESSTRRWSLEVNGRDAPRRSAFGVANVFDAPAGGRAEVRFHTQMGRYLALVVQLALWVAAVGLLIRLRRQRRS